MATIGSVCVSNATSGTRAEHCPGVGIGGGPGGFGGAGEGGGVGAFGDGGGFGDGGAGPGLLKKQGPCRVQLLGS